MEKRSPRSPQLPKALHEVMSAMGEKQRRLFGQYLDFEPFNPMRKLAQLYGLIDMHFYSKSRPNLEWEQALEQAGINLMQLDKLLSYMQFRLDQFLAMQQISQSPQRYWSYTLEAYNALRLETATREKKYRQIRKRLSSEPQSTELLQQRINLELFAIPILIEGHASEEGSYYDELNKLIDESDLLADLKACCASINESHMRRQPFPAERASTQEQRLAAAGTPLSAITEAYRAIFRLQTSASDQIESYEAVLEVLVKKAPEISSNDNWDLFNYLLNLCYPRLESQGQAFTSIIVRVYDRLMAMDLLAPDGQVPARLFKNVVSINCRQGNFASCIRFIKEYSNRLPKEDREILPLHCLGLVQFYEGSYRQAANNFKKVIQANPEDHFWSLESRSMLLKACYHLYDSLTVDELDELMRLVDAFKMYVRRHSKLDAYNQKCYLNFIKYFNLLLRHRGQSGLASHRGLRQKLEQEKMVTNRTWLLSALEEKG